MNLYKYLKGKYVLFDVSGNFFKYIFSPAFCILKSILTEHLPSHMKFKNLKWMFIWIFCRIPKTSAFPATYLGGYISQLFF